MTKKQAYREAKRRWGIHMFAYDEHRARDKTERFLVGYCDGWRDIILGYGPTWESAFAMANETPIDTSKWDWWGPHPEGVQQRHASWCVPQNVGCTCSYIHRIRFAV